MNDFKEWTDAETKPPFFTEVLITTDKQEIGFGSFNPNGWSCDDGIEGEVMGWLYLPKPYGVEKIDAESYHTDLKIDELRGK